ncbi:Hypothetical protein SMAX5B_013848 [Scophthalmus maximus]|uniref:Uncharacterized protein n=1 Tax=Scophthalmus maximus TaxID=52904 RepID=A0A2U9CIJ1_SCOMX|nr:Hypothetical protein SMAX5B_013848 [Scophthalmus maximus]
MHYTNWMLCTKWRHHPVFIEIVRLVRRVASFRATSGNLILRSSVTPIMPLGYENGSLCSRPSLIYLHLKT